MAYKALYRTYRPQSFEEVAGQQHIVKTLKNALATNKIAHAYLFAGPRGTGKTTMAKLFAKALNCDHGIGCQCNECKNCISITEGTHPDVIEIDAASNNGVDQVREIIDKVKYGTILGRYKVYIIDEVHMMSPGAFNALLKTLEEPPEHVIFILATTEPHKILPTILSRCQRYDFTKVSDEDIRERLKLVLEKEGIEYNEKAINIIISLADGGMRDALSMLDQVLAYSGNSLNEEDVLEIFSLESDEEKISLVNSIMDGNIADVLERINRYIDKGTDIKRLTSDLLGILKDLLIYINTRRDNFLQVISLEQAVSMSKKARPKQVMEMVNILLDALKDYKNVTSINPLFEVTLLKLVTLFDSEAPQVDEETAKVVIKPVVEQEDDVPVKVAPTPTVRKVKEEPSIFDTEIANVVLKDDIIEPKRASKKDGLYSIDDDFMVDIMVTSKKEIKNALLKDWSSLKKISANPTLGKAASLLMDAHPLVASNKILIIECPLNNQVNKINSVELQKDLENVVNTIFKNRYYVYAISRSESVRLQKHYVDLLTLGRLPKAKEVNIEFIGE